MKALLFAHALDADTNKVIASHLGEKVETAFHQGKKCADGQARNLWECPDDVIRILCASRKGSRLKFETFIDRQDGCGIVLLEDSGIPKPTPESIPATPTHHQDKSTGSRNHRVSRHQDRVKVTVTVDH